MNDLATPLVINAAITGMVPRKKDNPAVPTTPEEIAQDVERCYQAGARTIHIHARGDDEEPTYHRQVFSEIIRGIRKRIPQAIICVTTSGRVYKTFAERSDPLELDGDVTPDLASLTLGSMNFPRHASVNEPEMIGRLAARMAERGIVPELEIFEFGMLDYAHYLIGKRILQPPFVFNIILGSLGTLTATPLNLALMVERLPQPAFWSVGGIGRFQFPMNALGVVMGGHVRIGLEDNLYMDAAKTDPATNERLIQRIAKLACATGRTIATPEQARMLIGLR
ncbi:MAG: 3-keto-5-aminohexanoate cleavage protein [Chloroflexi bacterium]|nr:3-keto-5-aminohexanoate cleavage protein [Chloroflexota bacterium]